MPDTPPIPPAHFWLGYLLNRLAVGFRSRTTAALKPFGLNPRSLGVLLTVAQQETLNQVEIARRLGIDRTTMSQTVEDLLQAKWIRREALKSDRRSNLLKLTPQGMQRLKEASAAAEAAEREMMRMLSTHDADEVKRHLAHMLSHLEEDGDFQ